MVMILVVLVIVLGVYRFVQLVVLQTRRKARGSDKTAESMYDNHADRASAQRRYAKRHGGTWRGQPGR